ncbi:S8 family serine peptidase, partial [Patescibacteria group bacterium]|nr:S8 family serine peptidase [Patescibacteria group bacterium]
MKSQTLSYLGIATIIALFVGLFGFTVVAPTLTVAKEQANNNFTRVLIGFDKPVGASEKALVRAHGGKIKYSYSIVNAVAAQVPESSLNGLARNPHVTSIDIDDQVYAVDIELDNSWGVKHIKSGDVHATYSNKGMGVKIGIIDSGINYYHPDLNDNFDPANLGYDFYYYDYDPMDVYGHGTHVAGTACAEDNDNGNVDPKLGVVGVAPECNLYSLRVLNEDGVGYWSDIIAAVEWSTGALMQIENVFTGEILTVQGEKMDVINLSLGQSRDPGSTVKQAFDNAEAQGVVIVAAAGNSGNLKGKGSNTIYPANFDSVIAVAATDSLDNRASFSSTGDKVELAAPGVNVYSSWNDSTDYYGNPTTCRNGNINDCYKYGSGTSMASPHVAGVAALIIAAGIIDENGDGNINDEIRSVLQSTATDLGSSGRDPQFGFGLVNALAAVLSAMPPATGTISGNVTDVSTLLPVTGATVTDGTRSAVTDVSGNYTIANVPIGSYTVTASASGYENSTQLNVSVVADTATTVNFALNPILYGTIDGYVTDLTTSDPIVGASVTDGTRSAVTDTTGYYIISGVPEGDYTVSVSATGYQSNSQSVTVVGNTNTTANFSLQTVSQATIVSIDTITYTTEGGKNNDKHLNIAISLVDDLSNV